MAKRTRKEKPIKGAAKLIDDRGGVNHVSDVLGWPYSTVDTFRRKDEAPKYRWDVIAVLPVRQSQARAA